MTRARKSAAGLVCLIALVAAGCSRNGMTEPRSSAP
ncbi:Hydrolase OS=Streptomyces fumanus OX=67302 GN=GCM10018772_60850 PE=4 SV=1 [Streptomyces fumanus]